MNKPERLIWIFPLAVHLGYIGATFRFLPDIIGERASATSSVSIFLAQWLVILICSNIALGWILFRLPKFSDKMLSVSGKNNWLSTPEKRALLIERLEGFIETALLFANVFYLAVYQLIYQSNVKIPVIRIPLPVLLALFMVLPLIATLSHFIWLVIKLKK
jgi:hypothetical protein